MADVTIFQVMGSMFDNATATFVSSKATALITAIKPTAIVGTGLFLTLYGYLIMVGKIQEPFKDFMVKAIKIVLIAALALNAPNYLTGIVTVINALQTELGAALGAPGSIFAQLDASLATGFDLMNVSFSNAADADWYDIATIFRWYIVGLLVAVATIIIVLIGGVTIIMASLLLKIMLAIGPLFIMCLLWPATAKFFESWVGQTLSYVIKIILVGIVMSFAMVIFSRVINSANLGSATVNPMVVAGQVIIGGYILYRIVLEVAGVASALAGGVSMSVMSLGQLASAAVAPARLAGRAASGVRNAVDPMTTRRDMQSGMMTTARRSNHMIAGNTIANPAYRQHVMQNLNRNWGRKKGGEVDKG